MSKKLNTSVGGTPTNTLFNYFTKSPAVDKKKLVPSVKAESTPTDRTDSEKENLNNGKNLEVKKETETKPSAKRKLPISTPSDEEELGGRRKRKRIVLPESESEDEMEETKSEDDFSGDESDYEPDGKDDAASEESESGDDEGEEPMDDEESEDDPTPKKSRNKDKNHNNNNNEPVGQKVKLAEGSTFQEKLKNIQSNVKQDAAYDEIVTTSSSLDEPVVWPHQKLEFLQPDKIKDKEGRRPDHPDYDKSTLHVPEKFLNNLSPGVRQWWVLKSNNFDCVLFFKVGKFYELYHGDADVGVNELGFTYMRGEVLSLVDRVEPTETAHEVAQRCERVKYTQLDADEAQEICQITNLGTQVLGEQSKIRPHLPLCYMLGLVDCDIEILKERQAAIGELLRLPSELQEMRALLAPMPDFERNLAQIHLFGNKQVKQTGHPDSRAILFEEKIYNKQKLVGFMAVLKGFNALTKLPLMFQQCETPLIKRITQLTTSGGSFPDLSEELRYFSTAFDHDAAAKTGVIAPQPGMDAEYDVVMDRIEEIEKRLKTYLVEQERHFGCRVTYFGSDKKRYQLDVPESHAHKANKSYALEGQTKGKKPSRRYTTAETKGLLKDMQQAEDAKNAVLKDLARRLFEKFSNHYEQWKQCIDCVANLDVLGSLAEYARQQMVICVPELVSGVDQPFIELQEGYHPCVNTLTYIPNGLELGTKTEAPLSLLTGPNMGGKSTLMRELGLLVIMAQIGAHIPAASCRLSLVDRIFTRLGAQDDILAGHSTFLVELNETSLILKHATCHSLVLLDELGRGTATYDGTAIAASVVNFLANLKCRTLFSTHYHNLIDYFHNDQRVTLGHMACMVENEDTTDPTQETVTFLYKYTAGACPKSYGFNAAKLAGMPQGIIKRAFELSKKVEAIALQRKITAKIVASSGEKEFKQQKLHALKDLLQQLKMCHV
ncbi:GL25757 [Drosophila persimilis]|uniref:GL25757 n=1 Tax=Drosophila persimilis TaxID=7234 RepID=B4GUE0_DROPE|nr:GL25757 [Drosophila persimilis]